MSELHIAEHLLLRGFEIEGLERQKGSDPVPDLIARRGDLSIAVEVYAPREWEGLTWLTDNFVDALKNLDLPFDYSFNVRVEQLERFDAHHRLLICHPGELDRALDSDKRDAIIMPLVEEVEKRLCAGEAAFRVERSEREVNLRISVEVEQVAGNTNRLPMRKGYISLPTLSGYAPVGMFDRLTHRRVRNKAARGQAPRSGLAAISLLSVDLACAELSRELVHDYYRAKFEQIVCKCFGSGLFGYDAVALCQWHSWGEPTKLHFLVGRNGPAAVVHPEVFGS